MRINWFSPLPPAPSGIAYTTGVLLPYLARRAEVALWTDQGSWDKSLEEFATVHQFNPGELWWDTLNKSDATFYNMGNNARFHSAIWRASQRLPGVVILHEDALQGFFTIHYGEERSDPAGHVALMQKYYGNRGRLAAGQFWRGQRDIDSLSLDFPLTPAALEMALAVITHSRAAFLRVKKMGRWSVARLPLPEKAGPAPPPRRPHLPPYRLIIFGYLGLNRRLEQTLAALSGFVQRDLFQLHLYGEVRDPAALRRTIAALALEKLVHLHGLVPREELEAALASADFGINLRYPTMGEASGTQLQYWQHALPTMVTPVGFYSDLPEETVAHVRPGEETADIRRHLAAFAADPAPYYEMGRRGREFLAAAHAPEIYVDGLLEMAGRVPAFGAASMAQRVARRAGSLLQEFMDPAGLEETGERIAREATALLQAPSPRA